MGIRADGGLNIGQNTTGNTVAVGYGAGAANTGSSNVFLGYNSGSNNTTGSNNTAIGYGAGLASGSGSLTNSTALGYGAQATQSNSLVLGGTGSNAVNVGIGLTAPSATLDVNGTTRLRGLTTAGYVTTDAQGNLSSESGSGWSLTGNTLDGNQFIGSTNDQDFVVKRNNNEAFRVYSNGRISLGNNTGILVSVAGL